MALADLTGIVLDSRYRIIEPVAEGAMGVVYRAERVKLGRIVAVKVLHEVLPAELSSRRRFEIEAMAMAKLEHPHCASVVDVGTHEDRPFVVMDFVSGQNLRDVVAAEAPLPIVRAVEIMRQILSGLAHAHEHGIIHRDIKPANLVLSQKAGLGDHVKILDFGLARLSQDSSLTAGIVVGTPSYMAPEQIRGQPIDGRVDVYACGVVLFELLTGTKPFVSAKDDPIEVCTLHLKQPPPRLADLRPGIEFGELEAVVARALAKSVDERFASAVEFAAALDAIVPRRAAPTPVAGTPVVSSIASPVASPIASSDLLSGRTLPMPQPLSEAGEPAAAPAPAFASASAPAPAPGPVASGSGSGPTVAGAVATTPGMAPAPAGAAPSLAGAATVVGGASTTPGSAPPLAGAAATKPGMAPPPAGSIAAVVVSGTPPPLAVASSPAAATGGAPVVAAPRPRNMRRVAVIAGGGILLLVVIIAVVAGGGGAPAATPAPADAAAPRPPPSVDPADEAVAQANQLIAGGQKAAAIDLVVGARKLYPGDARLPYLLGMLNFDRYYWSDGMRMFREAIRLEPSYRADPELIRSVLRGFITTPRADAGIAAFLREDIGDAARPFLQETATDHPNAMIRERAASELRRYR